MGRRKTLREHLAEVSPKMERADAATERGQEPYDVSDEITEAEAAPGGEYDGSEDITVDHDPQETTDDVYRQANLAMTDKDWSLAIEYLTDCIIRVEGGEPIPYALHGRTRLNALGVLKSARGRCQRAQEGS
jgi:hypothetical protein